MRTMSGESGQKAYQCRGGNGDPVIHARGLQEDPMSGDTMLLTGSAKDGIVVRLLAMQA